MAVLHATAILSYQFLQRNTGRRELDAGIAHTPADAERAQAFAAIAAKTAKPLRPFFQNVTNPIQGFKIVLQRGPAKQPHFGNIGWAHARFTALALDAFNHGRLFAANIGASATPQFNRRQGTGRIGTQQLQFGFE